MSDAIPPQISLRALREALGLTLDQLAEQIARQGVEVTKFGLSNVETGKRRASGRLMDAWARALGTTALHVRQDRELRALVRATNADRRRKDETLEPAA